MIKEVSICFLQWGKTMQYCNWCPNGYMFNAREKRITASRYEYTSPSSTLMPMSHLKTSSLFKLLTRLAYAHRWITLSTQNHPLLSTTAAKQAPTPSAVMLKTQNAHHQEVAMTKNKNLFSPIKSLKWVKGKINKLVTKIRALYCSIISIGSSYLTSSSKFNPLVLYFSILIKTNIN